MNRFNACTLVAAAIALSATACSSSEANDVKTGLEDRNVVARLQELALQAASNAESKPTKVYAVAVSDHQDAETILSGAIINDHAPVYVIVMTGGHFIVMEHPLGAPAPEGDVLTLTVDAASYSVTDAGVVNVEPDLSSIALARIELSAN